MNLKLDAPRQIKATMTTTMTLGEWKNLNEQLSEYVGDDEAYEFRKQINYLINQATASFEVKEVE